MKKQERRTEIKLRQQINQLEDCLSCEVEENHKTCSNYEQNKQNVCAWYQVILNDLNKRGTDLPYTYNPKVLDDIMNRKGYCPIK